MATVQEKIELLHEKLAKVKAGGSVQYLFL